MQCLWRDGGCAGSNNDGCNPNHVWTGTTSSDTYAVPNLNGGSINTTGACNSGFCPASRGFSVRCVLVLNIVFNIAKYAKIAAIVVESHGLYVQQRLALEKLTPYSVPMCATYNIIIHSA